MDTKQPEGFESWAVVELMGHRRLAGFVTEQEVFGAGLLRIDVPGEGDAMTTQFYSPAALYSLTPVSETVARAYAAKNYMRPISAFDLALPSPTRADDEDDEDDLTPMPVLRRFRSQLDRAQHDTLQQQTCVLHDNQL